jgi:hypothetical protein
MAAATSTIPVFGRGGPYVDLAIIPVTFVFSATVYATASGGIPVDLTVALTSGAQPFSLAFINPLDVVGVMAGGGLSTNGFFPASLVIGSPTYTNPAVYPFAGAAQSNYPPGGTSQLGPQVRADVQLLTCPATFRLFGTGAGNALNFAEIANGAVTDTITVWLVVLRNGQNN